MRVIILACLLACITAAPNGPALTKENIERALSATLIEMLEELRHVMKKGNQLLGIPVMDPFKQDSIDVEHSFPLFSMKIQAEECSLVGLSNFQVKAVELISFPLGIKYEFTVPKSVIHADKYSFRGMVFNYLPIYGDGVCDFEIGELQIEGLSEIVDGKNGIYLKDLPFTVKIGSLQSTTTGMLGGGDIDNVVNAILTDLGPQFFEANSAAISELAEKLGLDKINSLLTGVTLSDLENVINGS